MTLVIDFCCKIGRYLENNGNYYNAQKIYKVGYEYVVRQIIYTSTSVIYTIIYIEYPIIKKMWTISFTLCYKIITK